MIGNQESLLAEADRATVEGSLSLAHQLLTKAAADPGAGRDVYLKLAAVSKAVGQPRAALVAAEKALARAPLDFVALVLRATLLDALGEAAGEAWHRALAHRPDGALPQSMSATIAGGEKKRDEWLSAREARMMLQMAKCEQPADTETRQRLARFRTNILRHTRPYHSEPTEFHYPGLVEREFHPRRLFRWIERLEDMTQDIVLELGAVMAAERAEMVPYIQYDDHLPLDVWRPLNNSRDWTAIHLWQNGRIIDANTRHCPRTMALLADIDQPKIPGAGPNAMFSLLAPHTAIPPHVGVSNARLVCHLPLVVPDGCWFRVGGETRKWHEGEAIVFDDSIEHEALNPTDSHRIVFIFDLWHPDLSEVEREAIAALIASEPMPGTSHEC